MTATSRDNRLLIWLEGCGAGILLMLRYTWLHLSPLHTDLYHRLLPMNAVYGGVAIDLLAACLLCVLILWVIERLDAQGSSLAWTIVGALLVTQAWAFVVWLGYINVHLIKPVWLALVCIAAGLGLWFWRRPFYGRGVKVFRGALALLGICIVWMLPQLVYMAIHPEPHDQQTFARAVAPAQTPRRRIIWIVFDELSQDQVFDHRQPGLTLPQLDRFRAQSVVFDDVRPAGYYTELVLPSLLWGRIITDERSGLTGDLSVKTSGRWHLLPAQQSLFADAERAGWTTGVAGWYNPYCRTYGPWLDWCGWTLRSAIPGKYRQGKSVWWNANAPLSRTEAKLTGRRNLFPETASEHADDYTELMRWSHTLIDDEKIGFLFLHLPLPHPGGFYDRKTGQIGANGSYIDNLALTDRSLGELMQWVSQTGLASQTTVIVCSDHSWRVPLWRKTPLWTAEDERASGGRFDSRPVLMVHFPGETSPKVVSQPFPAIREHNLIKMLLHKSMTAAGLVDWAGKQ
jgi:hypothetical protein